MKRGLQYKNSLYKNQTCPTWTPPGCRSCSPAELPPSRQWSDLERLRQWGPSPPHEWTGFWRMRPVVVLPWMDKKRILILERKISNCSCAIQNIWEKIILLTSCLGAYILNGYIAQCAVCKVRRHCIFYGPGIRYSDIFGAPGIGYSVIIKLPCALLQTVHAPVADTVAYFAGLNAPVVDTVTYFGGNHRSRVWKSLKLKQVFFPRTRTSWDKYMLKRIVFLTI